MSEGNWDLPTIFIILFGQYDSMARNESNPLLHQVRGQIGEQIVVKRYGKKTVISLSGYEPGETG
jgi:hypothetical protein